MTLTLTLTLKTDSFLHDTLYNLTLILGDCWNFCNIPLKEPDPQKEYIAFDIDGTCLEFMLEGDKLKVVYCEEIGDIGAAGAFMSLDALPEDWKSKVFQILNDHTVEGYPEQS